VPDRPDLPDDVADPDILARAAQYALDHDIAPQLSDPFAMSRTKDVAILVACLDRQRRLGGVIEEIERDELGALLGRRPATSEQGLDELDAAIRQAHLADDEVLSYLTRRSYRLEWLWSPACSLYPDRAWAAID
jgi:hypothetical protein